MVVVRNWRLIVNSEFIDLGEVEILVVVVCCELLLVCDLNATRT